jgi:hypothetical protein
MQKIWLPALALALAASVPAAANAAGRVQDSATPYPAASYHAADAAGGESYDYGVGTYVYHDFLNPRHERSEAAEQAATRLCDHGVADDIGLAPFNACMRAHGWRFARFFAAPSHVEPASDPAPVDNSIDSFNQTQQMLNDMQAAQAANNAAQQQFNDAMNAQQAFENSFPANPQ